VIEFCRNGFIFRDLLVKLFDPFEFRQKKTPHLEYHLKKIAPLIQRARNKSAMGNPLTASLNIPTNLVSVKYDFIIVMLLF
jgi:hypothetical protein